MMMKKGFTLAEVLITLGIIGVVAAMTLPTLVAKYRGIVLKTQLDKAYSICSTALQRLSFDEGGLKVVNIEHREFKEKFAKYFSGYKDCGTESCEERFGTDSDGNATKNVSYKYKTFNNRTLNNFELDDGQFILSDGMFIMIQNELGSDGSLVGHVYISVDVNGLNVKPNRWGHDLFTFQVLDGGKLLPMGAENTDYYNNENSCSVSSSATNNGIGCTYKALTDKDYFKNLPK